MKHDDIIGDCLRFILGCVGLCILGAQIAEVVGNTWHHWAGPMVIFWAALWGTLTIGGHR